MAKLLRFGLPSMKMVGHSTSDDEITLRAHIGLRRVPMVSLAWILLSALITAWSRTGAAPLAVDRWIDFGAKTNAAILESGEWYRLLSCAFLHVHWPHLLFNALYLLAFGGALESIFRHRHALTLFVMAAAATSAASMAASPAVACGASGVVAAALGAVATLALLERRFPRRLRLSFLAACVPASILFIAFSMFTVGVDHAGHAAGAMCGVLFALWCPNRFDAGSQVAPSRAFVSGGIAVVGLCLLSPASIGWYGPPVRPTDDLSFEVPDTLTPLATGSSYRAYGNELGSTLVVSWGALEDSGTAYDAFLNDDLRRLRESDDVRWVGAEGPEAIQIGARQGRMLTLSYEGPRGPMVGCHVWVEGPESWLHVAWTGRANRQAQNGVMLRTFLSRLAFH